MSQPQNQFTMTIEDAIMNLDKKCGRSTVKLEELFEDINNIRQMIPQIVKFYEQKMLEAKAVMQAFETQIKDAKEHMDKLEHLLVSHIPSGEIPERPKSLQPPELLKTQK